MSEPTIIDAEFEETEAIEITLEDIRRQSVKIRRTSRPTFTGTKEHTRTLPRDDRSRYRNL